VDATTPKSRKRKWEEKNTRNKTEGEGMTLFVLGCPIRPRKISRVFIYISYLFTP